MNFMLQTHGSQYLCSIPDGLRELMMDISREVLRSQPEEVYSFVADYLDALLVTREHARVAARVVASLADASATIAELLQRTGMSREQAEDAARIVQVSFREHTEARHKGSTEKLKEFEILQHIIQMTKVKPAEAVKAAVVIQSAFKSYMQRLHLDSTTCRDTMGVDWMKAARNTLALYERTRPTKAQLQAAATLIQAVYKGYFVRKILLTLKQKAEEEQRKAKEQEQFEHWVFDNAALIEPAASCVQRNFRVWLGKGSTKEEFSYDLDDPELNEAATMIQRQFREYHEDIDAAATAEETEGTEEYSDVDRLEEISYPGVTFENDEIEELPAEDESEVYGVDVEIPIDQGPSEDEADEGDEDEDQEEDQEGDQDDDQAEEEEEDMEDEEDEGDDQEDQEDQEEDEEEGE